jgi:mannonate dehydratase
MILADFLPATRDRTWDLARQCGITHAIVKCAPELTGLNPHWDLDALRTIQRRFADAGLTVQGRGHASESGRAGLVAVLPSW